MLKKITTEYIELLKKQNNIDISNTQDYSSSILDIENYLLENDIVSILNSFKSIITNITNVNLHYTKNSFSTSLNINYSGLGSCISSFGKRDIDLYLKFKNLTVENMSLKRYENNFNGFHKSLLLATTVDYPIHNRIDCFLNVIDDQFYKILLEHSDLVYNKYKILNLILNSISKLENITNSNYGNYNFIIEKYPILKDTNFFVDIQINELIELLSEKNDFIKLTEDKDLISENINEIKENLLKINIPIVKNKKYINI